MSDQVKPLKWLIARAVFWFVLAWLSVLFAYMMWAELAGNP